MNTRPLAIVSGVGPGTGAALVRRFAAGGYAVAMLARSRGVIDALADEVEHAHAFACDVGDEAQLHFTLGAIDNAFGAAEVLVHNAVNGSLGSFMEIKPSSLQRNFNVNTMALLHLARHVALAMIAAGKGTIIATGNTASLRGKKNFAGFAPTKAAARILLESIARELGPKGVHVAYLLIDGVIDHDWTRKLKPDAPDEFFVAPRAIAEEAFHLTQQDRSAWSFLTEIRPHGETW